MVFKFLTILIVVFGFVNHLKASHAIGGDITWKCLSNGQYIFYLNTYRECTGTQYFFNTQTISYPGGSITMKPDSNRWISLDSGNISPIGPTGCQRSCDNPAEPGAVQFFPYKSDPITLNGVPPPGGWLFTWGPLCCRTPSMANLSNSTNDSYTLRAKMYPYKGKSTANCYDSSPIFDEQPAIVVCRGEDFIFNHSVVDEDLDSLVYSWAQPWDVPNVPVVFASDFSYDNPMPDTSAHPLNKAAVLNNQTGEIRFGTYSGHSGQQYVIALQVDAYREGVKIASVYRDLPFVLFDCPPLPGTGFDNNPPTAMINGVPAIAYVDTVYAGQKVTLPFQSTENDIIYTDPTDPTTATLQQNYLSPQGMLFSNDFVDSTDCKEAGFVPCATLTPAPTLNPINGEMELTNQGTVTTLFEWQTGCNHLYADSNEMSNGRTFNFIMKTYDDHCDFPGVIYPSISIFVEKYKPTIQANGNILSVDTAESYQWFYNGNPLPNTDTNSISMQGNGLYSVEVVKYGCPSKRANHLLNVSLSELGWENDLKIYPNPFKDGFVVEFSSMPKEEVRFQLTDVGGRELHTRATEKNNRVFIDADDNLHQGIYILKISTGDQSVLKKMVKL